ncbi:hypothetical protein C5N14_28340 [Micromonospora sp. MW-13]|uniref:hypothetical protein n=1 Tax=Micromonospora sp. MW-13 TaxID=2094022 RepID=UPI000EEB2008|nr:hypothetical protein [Micromonospora sp. MW-13]RGC65516.1 hypothetical protein C5N14_28340 [Micromonospora sp. MW-13]
MTVTVAPVWRPFDDEPLFVPELLLGPAAIPTDLTHWIVGYLTAVAQTRTAPLHTCTAFNALHFGFDVETHGYRAEVLTPDLFVPVAVQPQARRVLPVGTFVHLDRGGRRSLLAEVVARYGADPEVDVDGWTPAELSGAPAGVEQSDGTRTGIERVILDVQAFGALNAADYSELSRLRRQVLDNRGHLTGPVQYLAGTDDRDDVALYAAYLLGPARPLLLGGPLAQLLTDPGDEQVLAAALYQAFDTIGQLLDGAAGLRRWNGYAVCGDRFTRRSHEGWPGLPAADIDDVVATVRRSALNPRYTAVWPLLSSRIPAGGTPDPLGLTSAAEIVVHTNLVAADLAGTAVDGLLPERVHLRVDDAWQAGGVWRTQREPVSALVVAADPRIPLGLGHSPAVDTIGTVAPAIEPAGPDTLGDSDGSAEPQPEPVEPDAPVDDDNPGEKQHGPAGPGIDEVPPGPTPADTSTADEGETDLVVVADSLVVFTVALRESHWEAGDLALPPAATGVLGAGSLIMQLHHDGDTLDDSEQVQQINRSGATLTGVSWPWSFYAGIKITVAAARNATRISVTTTLLNQPLPYGDQYRWDADTAILAASIGAEPPAADAAAVPPSPEPLPPAVSERQRGVPQLQPLIISALHRHGEQGAFGARRLTGPQLLAALFGPDLVAPPLMWQVVYTCDRLVDAGTLTKEPGKPAEDGKPGRLETFVWWPDGTARRNGHRPPTRAEILAGQVREHWVPAFKRRLQPGHQASDTARREYAAWVLKVHGPGADTRLPDGYTWVRGQLRGSGESAPLLHLAVPQQPRH